MSTTLENLPDEILLMICRYLKQHHIILAFFGLNTRLNCTISEFCESTTVTDSGYYTTIILSLIGPSLNSLRIKNTTLTSTQMNLARNIKEITFQNTEPHLINILPFLTDLNVINGPNMTSINVLFGNSKTLHSVYIASWSPFTFPEMSANKTSTIQQLALTLLSLKDLKNLLSSCPKLTCLNLYLQHCDFENRITIDSQLCSNLTIFSLRTSYDDPINLENIKYLMEYLPRQLEHLSIEIRTSDPNTLDGNAWKSYIMETFPTLQSFQFFIVYTADPSTHIKLNLSTILAKFRNSFWSTVVPQDMTGYYNANRSLCIHTNGIPTVRRRRYFLY